MTTGHPPLRSSRVDTTQFFDLLPVEVIDHIFYYLTLEPLGSQLELLRIRTVCKFWERCVNSTSAWRIVYYSTQWKFYVDLPNNPKDWKDFCIARLCLDNWLGDRRR
eukprot:TRINITY_DN6053_c0_g1_i2.p1 TRINITY_DN6053_c0_g1~~TRINITY_DN6053_c0_g1_i2.p1  ORF type:complete len:118 (-),score=10.32 TRINITY_DN6053_c0_g1_i2:403-723(-)